MLHGSRCTPKAGRSIARKSFSARGSGTPAHAQLNWGETGVSGVLDRGVEESGERLQALLPKCRIFGLADDY